MGLLGERLWSEWLQIGAPVQETVSLTPMRTRSDPPGQELCGRKGILQDAGGRERVWEGEVGMSRLGTQLTCAHSLLQSSSSAPCRESFIEDQAGKGEMGFADSLPISGFGRVDWQLRDCHSFFKPAFFNYCSTFN